MSVSTIRIALDRVASATIESPIAIFRAGNLTDQVDCFFANTITGRDRIMTGRGMIGVFDGTESKEAVRKRILDAIVKKSAPIRLFCSDSVPTFRG